MDIAQDPEIVASIIICGLSDSWTDLDAECQQHILQDAQELLDILPTNNLKRLHIETLLHLRHQFSASQTHETYSTTAIELLPKRTH